jgi:xanthine dehydrogenase small subunit
MIQFILNNETIATNEPAGLTVLDFIRYKKHLKGTKIGCREGDCGACTILVGERADDTVRYRSMTSCLMPLANAHGKHIVTIEGINTEGGNLTTVQTALVEESGTQCGFCTVGFVMSLTGLCLDNQAIAYDKAIEAIDGNICRCTGYKSIERAAQRLTILLKTRNTHDNSLDFAIKNGIVPAYFKEIKSRLISLQTFQKYVTFRKLDTKIHVGGGTDLYVQKHEDMIRTPANYLFETTHFNKIISKEDYFEINSAATVTDLKECEALNTIFPHLQKHLKLVSSTPIRNMATIAGNLVNASPIGDLTVFLLALNSTIFLKNTEGVERDIYLKDFYKGYKILDKTADEVLTKICFKNPNSSLWGVGGAYHFNFEKVSKRTYLDIASVNTAIFIKTDKGKITEVHVSMGGVAPIPLYLKKVSQFLKGKDPLSYEVYFNEMNAILQEEINPISDVRGSAAYKRLLARQLLKAHFVELFEPISTPAF